MLRDSIYGLKEHVPADADTAPVEDLAVTPRDVHDRGQGEAMTTEIIRGKSPS
jgi:hypothetical protein